MRLVFKPVLLISILQYIIEINKTGVQASLIDFNNVLQYVESWGDVLAKPPLKEGGVILIGMNGMNKSTIYELPGGVFHPGEVVPDSSGFAGTKVQKPEGSIGRDVVDVLERGGYKLLDKNRIMAAESLFFPHLNQTSIWGDAHTIFSFEF